MSYKTGLYCYLLRAKTGHEAPKLEDQYMGNSVYVAPMYHSRRNVWESKPLRR